MNVTQAVLKVFDTYPGQTLNLPAVTAMALQALEVRPEEYNDLKKRVEASIRSQAKKGKLAILSGKYGGVYRLVDMTPEQRKKVAKLAKRQTKVKLINREIRKLERKRERILNGR